MAEEKILNTRIVLKHDTLANWSTQNPTLKEGEVGFITIAATQGSGLTEPVTMMKIGDGTHAFNDLGWDFYAKASDVYEWAKKNEVKITGTGNAVTNASISTIDGKSYLTFEKGATFATKAELEAAVEAFGGDISKITDNDHRYTFEIVNGKLTINAVNYVNGKAGESTQVAALDVVTPTQLSTNHYTKTESDLRYAPIDIDTGVMSVTGSEGIVANNTDGAVVLRHTFANDVGNIELGATPNGLFGKANISISEEAATTPTTDTVIVPGAMEANGLSITAKWTEVATQAGVDKALAAAKKYADDNDANTEYHVEYDSTNKKIKLVAGADNSKMEIPTDDFIKDGMIQTVEIKDNKLVITWNTDAGKSATEIPLTELVDIMTGVDGTTITVNVSADDKISAEIKTGVIKDGHIAADAAIAKSKLSTEVQTSLGKADNAVDQNQYDGAMQIINGRLATLEGINHDAYAKDADLAAIAKSGNVNDLIQTAGDVLVFDCGTASKNI
jgi:hypothetical protein